MCVCLRIEDFQIIYDKNLSLKNGNETYRPNTAESVKIKEFKRV